jgi:hypothetical protein
MKLQKNTLTSIIIGNNIQASTIIFKSPEASGRSQLVTV